MKILKKAFMALAFLLMLVSCQEEMPTPDWNKKPVKEETGAVIEKLYPISMRREVPFPFSAYVMRMNNGKDLYMLRYRYNRDLRVGDYIRYQVFSFCPDEIAVLNGQDLGDGSDATRVAETETRSLVASDPIEADVTDVFDMKIRYSVTFAPIDTWFIELSDGQLIYVKKSKCKLKLSQGDHIVYNTYTLSPNEVLAIKKLN